MNDKNVILDRTHVPDKLFAYTLQIKHMLYELIDADKDDIISIEFLDDVAIQNDDKNELVQLKNSISKNNPISNRAVDFWKTFYNWFTYVKKGNINVYKTKFRLLIHTNDIKIMGEICKQFNDANNIDEAQKAIETAKLEITGSEAESYKKYTDVIFNEKNNEIITNIILNFKVQIKLSESYDEELLEKLKNRILMDEYIENMLIYLLGWVEEKVNQETKFGNPAFIKYCDFEKELKSQISMYRQNSILHAVAVEIDDKELNEEIIKDDIYIKQLNLINVDYEDKIAAVNAFLRNSIDKTYWANEGLINSVSFNEYQQKLIQNWNSSKKIIESNKVINPNINDEIAGKQLYYMCINNYNFKLQGKELPYYFSLGEYNQLSNELRLGWHPKYRELILYKQGENDETE